MAEYLVNKGVDKSIECFGLRSQYVLFTGVGIVVLFFITSTLLAMDISILFVIAFIGIIGSSLFFLSTWMNKNMGQHGLTKLYARRLRHKLYSNRKSITSIIKTNKSWLTQKK